MGTFEALDDMAFIQFDSYHYHDFFHGANRI